MAGNQNVDCRRQCPGRASPLSRYRLPLPLTVHFALRILATAEMTRSQSLLIAGGHSTSSKGLESGLESSFSATIPILDMEHFIERLHIAHSQAHAISDDHSRPRCGSLTNSPSFSSRRKLSAHSELSRKLSDYRHDSQPTRTRRTSGNLLHHIHFPHHHHHHNGDHDEHHGHRQLHMSLR